MPRRRAQYFLFDLVMWVTFFGLFFGFVRWAGRMDSREGGSFPGLGFYVTGFGVWIVVWSVTRAKRTGPVCTECGQRFIAASRDSKPTVCPRCRMVALTPERRRREQAKGWFALLVWTALLAACIGLLLGNLTPQDARAGRSDWVVVVLRGCGVTFGLAAACFVAAVAIALLRARLLCLEMPALRFARACSGQVGTIARSGPVTTWWCGAAEPTAMLREAMETSRRRFEHLVSRPFEAPGFPKLRVVVFEKRRDFLAYHRNVAVYLRDTAGVYKPRPAREISLETEAGRCRIHEPEKTSRTLFFDVPLRKTW
jgi:hypothetical protein